MSDRQLVPATPGETPTHEDVQQLVEAEAGLGDQGVLRTWLASNSDKVVLVSDADGVRISEDDGTTVPSQVLVASMLDELMDEMVPPGAIWAYGGGTAPAGWLLCNGGVVSRAAYAKLFAVIGTAYGAGDGSTTFALPDMRGRVVLGASTTHPRGQTGGAETHLHEVNIDHNHTGRRVGRRARWIGSFLGAGRTPITRGTPTSTTC